GPLDAWRVPRSARRCRGGRAGARAVPARRVRAVRARARGEAGERAGRRGRLTMGQRPKAAVPVDRERCAARIQDQIDRLSAPPFTSEVGSVTRYAFTEPYMRTVEHLST